MTAAPLPAPIGLGDRLAPYITSGADTLANALIKRAGFQKENADLENDKKVISKFAENPNPSAQDFAGVFSQLSREGQKNASSFLENIYKTSTEAYKKKAETEAENVGLQNTFKELKENIPYTGIPALGAKSFFAWIPGTEGYGKREQFTTQGFFAADKIFTKFNKGTISKEKLAVIRNDLAPRADLSEVENRARIHTLQTIANLPDDVSESKLTATIKKTMSDEEKEAPERLQKVEKGTKLSDDAAQQILAQANGDKQKAREIARGLGYEF